MKAEGKYKKTEVGVIPEDWEVKEFGELCSPSKEKFNPMISSAMKCVELEDIAQSKGRLLNVSSTLNKLSLKTIFKKEDILFGKLRPYLRKYYFSEFDGVCSTEIWALKAKFIIYPRFLYQIVKSDRIIDAANISSGTKMPRADWSIIQREKIPLPPLPEQTAIATALSDMDALIAQTEKLIEKKKAIKQGAMQELLTGRTRLSGFGKDLTDQQRSNFASSDELPQGYKKTEVGMIPEDWEIYNISDTSTMKARIGWQGLTTSEYLRSGDYYLVTGTDFFEGKIKWETCHFVAKNRFYQDKNIQVKQNDILITKDGTIGKVAFIDQMPLEATLNSGIFVIRPLSYAYNPKFCYYIFKSHYFDSFLRKLVAGSTINHLYQKDFVSFEFPLPPLTEQTAIATALSDMDAEIQILESKLQKLKLQKQGMMQALLTGKIRLV